MLVILTTEASSITVTVSTKCRLQTADHTRYKVQTEFKMQSDKKNCFFCVRNEITFDFTRSTSYLPSVLSRNNLTMLSPVNNTITLSLSFFLEMLFYRMVQYWFISSCGKIKRYNACETSPKLSGENFGHLRM